MKFKKRDESNQNLFCSDPFYSYKAKFRVTPQLYPLGLHRAASPLLDPVVNVGGNTGNILPLIIIITLTRVFSSHLGARPCFQPAIGADARLSCSSFSAQTYSERMSGITGSLDCDDCKFPVHVANSTDQHAHSTMDADDELLRYIWTEYLHPKEYEWVLIVAYIIVFFVSLIGNSLGKCLEPKRTRALSSHA